MPLLLDTVVTGDDRSLTGMPTAALRPRRRPLWIVAGVLSLLLGALVAVWLFGQLGSTQRVLQITTPVSRGDVIRAEHLTLVTIGAAPGVSVVNGERVDEIVGRTALIDLAPGALMPDGAVGDAPVPVGKVQIGLRLAPGRMPGAEIPPHTSVLLVPVAASGAEAPRNHSVAAEVVGHPRILDDGSALVDVVVERPDAESVARWAASDQLSLVREF